MGTFSTRNRRDEHRVGVERIYRRYSIYIKMETDLIFRYRVVLFRWKSFHLNRLVKNMFALTNEESEVQATWTSPLFLRYMV